MNRAKRRLGGFAATLIAGMAILSSGHIGFQTANAADSDNGNKPSAREDGPPPGPPPGDRPREGQTDRPREGQGDRPQREGQPADGAPREGQARPERGPGGPPGVQRAIDELRLSDEQKQKVDPIVHEFRKKQQQAREDFLKDMKSVLEPAQFEKLQSAVTAPPPGPRESNGDTREPSRQRTGDAPRGDNPDAPKRNPDAPQDGRPGTSRPDAPPARRGAAPDPQAAAPVDGAEKLAVTFTGGYETDPRDHGRPVRLIAAALEVSPEVFRNAFSHVKPAGPGQQPQDAQVRLNKAQLMGYLTPYAITNDRLDEVSNFYRYSSSKGEMWRNTPAAAYATVHDGVVTGITLTNPGSGYTTPPKIAVAGMPNVNAIAYLAFDKDFGKNGSIKEIVVKP